MKQEIAEQWVRELRSGEHQQGKMRLHYTDGRKCCLGVLCDIAHRDGVVRREERVDKYAASVYEYFIGNSRIKTAACLPDPVMKWSGMRSTHGVCDGFDALTRMNDDGKTFSEIADHIEANWENL